MISVLTFLYWRHTKPEDEYYAYGEPVDDDEGSGTTRGVRDGPPASDGPATQQLPALGPDEGTVRLDPEPLRIVTREDLERGTVDDDG